MKRKGLWVLAFIVAFILIDVFVLDAYLDKNVDTAQIKEVITTECDCEKVSAMSFKGLSLPDLILGDRHEFTISNCQFDNFEADIAALHIKLQERISNFKEADLVRFSFSQVSGVDRLVEIRHDELTINN